MGEECRGRCCAARTAALEPGGEFIGERVAGEAFEPDRPPGQTAPDRAGAGDHHVSPFTLVEALGQGQVRDAAFLQSAQPSDLATLQRVVGAEGLPGAENARGEAGPGSGRWWVCGAV